MGPSRGDTICGNVAIEALGPMHFGALALGPIHRARNPTEPKIWLATIECTLLPRSVDVSRFMAGVGGLAANNIAGAVPLVLVDREADFCVVGYRAIEGARTLAAIAEEGVDVAAASSLARQLAQTLAELHRHGAVHGLLTPTTVIHDGERWWTWEYGIAEFCAPDRLAPRLRPLGGDVVAPELRVGGVVSSASDVFGWGAAVACLLTGTSGSDAVAVLQDSDANDPLTEFVRACLETIPELRPRDGNALCERLLALFPSAAPPGGTVPEPPSSVVIEEFALDDTAPPAVSPAPLRSIAASESSEFSFAELNEASLLPETAAHSSGTHEIVELLVLGPDDDDEDEHAANASEPEPEPPGPQPWQELAERYLLEGAGAARGLIVPPIESASDQRSVEALGRVALVRVRTGPQKLSSMDHVAVAGAFDMPEEPEPEPTVHPRAAEGAGALPLGSPDEDDDWDDPDAAVFDLDSPGAPRVELSEEDVDPDPDPDGLLDGATAPAVIDPAKWAEPTPIDGLGSPRAAQARVQLDEETPAEQPVLPALVAPASSQPRLELAPREPPRASRSEAPAPQEPRVKAMSARAGTSEPALVLDRTPSRPMSLSQSSPALDRTPSRSDLIPADLSQVGRVGERSGSAIAWTVGLLAGVLAIGATLAAARERGGVSRLLGGGAPTAGPTPEPEPTKALSSPSPDPSPPPVECPPTMRPIDGLGVCVDEAEAPGLHEIPQTQVSLADARAACLERGAALCSPQQWRAACRGSRNWRHPYGSRAEVDRCNGASPSGAIQDLSRAGARDGCVTPSGVYDLEGNVGEWVEDGSVLGGDSSTRAPSCDSRAQPAAGTVSPSTGFRCCLELAPPG